LTIYNAILCATFDLQKNASLLAVHIKMYGSLTAHAFCFMAYISFETINEKSTRYNEREANVSFGTIRIVNGTH